MDLLRRLMGWLEDRTGLVSLVRRLAQHPVPPRAGWRYVFGSATLLAFLLQVVTGVALATVYVPSAGQAYQSLQYISHDAAFGHVLRGMHYFGASAMMILVVAHLVRVFLTASYKYPRELNWLSGVLLLGLTVVMAFTGQLLRWDQDAIWSEVVAVEQVGRVPALGRALAHFLLGGGTIGGLTLTRSFDFHVFLVPALVFGFIGVHLWLVLRAGISEPPEVSAPADPATYRAWYAGLLARRGRPFWPDAAWRDTLFGALVLGTVIVLALVVGPPLLGSPPDPANISASPRPDWYFLWYFAVLALLPPRLETPVIVLAPLLAGLALLALPFVGGRGSRHLRDRWWAVVLVVLAFGGIGWLTRAGARAPWSPAFGAAPLDAATVGATSGPVATGAALFHDRGCESCHAIAGHGGARGPDLTDVAARLGRAQIISRVLGGGGNMPAYAGVLGRDDLDAIVTFLESRRGAAASSAPGDDGRTPATAAAGPGR